MRPVGGRLANHFGRLNLRRRLRGVGSIVVLALLVILV